MSINSSDLQILVARTAETEKISSHKGRAGQDAVVMAGMEQKTEAERSQQRVGSTPKAEGGKVAKDGGKRNSKENRKRHDSKKEDPRSGSGRTQGTEHIIDIVI
ncbi:MAG: hypothetical protein H0Z38_09505 [Firmicutes bacterium]|nr:hypothetical protein [Bacillota bacterium]